MHNSSLNGRTAARKAYSSASTAQTNTLPHFENGFVIHEALSPSDQVRILAVVDETGSAPLGDILAVLEGHREPVEAVTALVHAGTLEFGQHQLVDVNTLVFRRCENTNPIGSGTLRETPTAPVANGPVADIEQENANCSFFALDTLELRAQVHITTDRRLRGVGVNRQLEQAGVYIKIFGDIAYVGCGSRVKSRLNVAPNGLNKKPDEIFVITDANNRLTVDDSYVLERILWDRMKAAGHNLMPQDTPDGRHVGNVRYEQITLFAIEALLILRQAGIAFTQSTLRKMFAGPVFEQEMLGKRRDWSKLPPGVVYESTYNEMTALAAEQNNGTSLLLRGSEIALTACSKSPAAISFLRAYGNYSGILEKAEDGRSYIVMRDLVFKSQRQLAQFFSGQSNISKLEWTRLNTPTEELEAPVR